MADWFVGGKLLPKSVHAELMALLEPGEELLCGFVPDLNASLRYVEGCVVLTSRRILARVDVEAEPEHNGKAEIAETVRAPQGGKWTSWSLRSITRIKSHDRGGLGTLEISSVDRRLAKWHYTLGNGPAVQDLIAKFDVLQSGPETASKGTTTDIPQAEEMPEPPTTGALVRLVRFARPRMGAILLGILLSFASTAAGLIPPYLTVPLLDEVLIPYQHKMAVSRAEVEREQDPVRREKLQAENKLSAHQEFTKIPWYLVGLAGAAVAAWLLSWAQGAVLAWVSERISADLRNQTYAHLQKLSLEYFGGKRTGDLMSRVSTDTDRLCNFLSDSVVDFASDVLMLIGTAAVLLYIDPYLAVASLLPFPFIAYLLFQTRDKLQNGFLHGGRTWAHMTSVLADTIPGIRVVKAFAQEKREIERFRQANTAVVAANDKVNSVWTFFWPLVALVNQVGLLVVWGFGAWRVFDFQITVGVLTAFLAYIGRFYSRLESMSRMATNAQRAAASAQRIFEVLDRVPSVPEPARPVSLGKVHGDIEFRGVGFRYGNRQVFQDLTFSIRSGEMIGLVGQTGAGKSTLINLVCRFFDVADGGVFVDGVDIRSLPVAEYRRNIGIVLQDPFLFFGTIAENISYGRPEATREEIVAVARAARAHDFILHLPDGYDSLVGERGQSLSGGERQRISIARALLINPKILILDEATSAVDTQTEKEIQEALQNLIQGRTTIAIAHRLSTLSQADRIIVLGRGRILEQGPHAELLELEGEYYKLHQAQVKLHEDIVV